MFFKSLGSSLLKTNSFTRTAALVSAASATATALSMHYWQQNYQSNSQVVAAESEQQAKTQEDVAPNSEWWRSEKYKPKTYNGEWNKDWIDASKYNGTRTIVLVRHGQYMNESSSNEDIKKLTPTGEKQCFYTGEYLSKLIGVQPENSDDDTFVIPISSIKNLRIVSSDMLRAKQTAQIITKAMSHGPLGDLKFDVDSDLREGFPCVPSPPNKRWLDNISEEEREVDPQRMERAFKKYFTPKESEGNEVVVLVNHGNVIRHLVTKAVQLPEEAWLRFSIANGSVTVLQIRPNGYVSVKCIGDFGAIPIRSATFRNIT